MKTKFVALLVIMCICIVPFGTVPVFAAKSGTYGANLTWTLDNNGTLTISGNGAMPDFTFTYIYGHPSSSEIKTVVIKHGVTTIGNDAFSGCYDLTSVVISDSVTSIGNSAFWQCGSLTSVTIPDSVTSIGDSAFSQCYSLTSITIPDSVTSIGDNAFFDCQSLTSIIVDENNPNYCSVNGNLFNKDKTTLIQYAIGKFDTHYTIPDSVTTIGYYAFFGCKNLSSTNIGNNVAIIDYGAFSYCESLTIVNISDSVTTIGEWAFDHCNSLTSITIPDNVIYIHNNAFSYSCNLTSIIVDDNNPNYCSIDGNLFNKEKTELIQYAIGKSDTHYTIPNGITTIGERAFVICDNLISVTIPDSATSIGVYAFGNCDNLTSVTLGESITTIGASAFYDCDSLSSVTLDNKVTTIDNDAFFACDSLTDVYYTGSKSEWNEISIGSYNDNLTSATIHYNYVPPHNCVDNDSNHNCDVCGEVLSVCADDDSDHKCDVCGEALSTCADKDNNHKCDVCGEVLSTCADNDINHNCDVCGEVLSVCADDDRNHKCDICGDILSSCADIDKNKKCDICGESTIEIISMGSCGASATWLLDNYGVLTISGSGSMTDFSSTSNIPWYSSRSDISEIIIGDGITHIGNKSFYNCISARKITIPVNVVSIGTSVFNNCEQITILTDAGTYAEEYAKENGIPFVSTGKTELENMTVDVAENEQKWYFDVSIAIHINGAKVYAAVYDEKGTMLSVNSVDLESEDVTTVSLTKQSDADYVKLFVWASDFNPVAFSETIDV